MNDASVPQDPRPEEMGRTSDAPPPVEPLSFSDKFIGILTEPSATFANVRAVGPRTSDWLLPVLILMIVIAGATLARFSNPEAVAQIMDAQTEAIQKQVDSGEITQEEADRIRSQMESMSGLYGVFGAISGAIGYFIVFFIVALFYWLVVKFALGGEVGYTAILSILGLSNFISILDQLVSLLLSYATGSMFVNLSPILFVGGDMTTLGMGMKMLMLLNPIAIWATWVVGIGLENVAMLSRTKAMITAFALYIAFTAVTLALGGMGMG
ncbi:MAG: YIP1 family protein [Bacteroidota bacterium]|nr:YIP1 family protein [Bacteroidota bacterium]